MTVTVTVSPLALPSVLRTFALSDTMCPPVPVTIAPTFSSLTSSTVTSTLTVLPVPKNSAESGISTQLQVSPLTSTPIVASKLYPAAAMSAPYFPGGSACAALREAPARGKETGRCPPECRSRSRY